MASFATFDDLKRFGQEFNEERTIKLASSSLANKNTFLSHSSKDSQFLAGVIHILERNGGSVYIDKTDERLPEKTNRNTANILKSTIQSCRSFVLFVTTNSKDSRWIPWELGLADGCKGENRIALFPVANLSYDQLWAQQEYLGLYQRIVWGNLQGYDEPDWLVYNHIDNTAQKLSNWLK